MSDERRWFLLGVVDALCVASLIWLIMEIVFIPLARCCM